MLNHKSKSQKAIFWLTLKLPLLTSWTLSVAFLTSEHGEGPNVSPKPWNWLRGRSQGNARTLRRGGCWPEQRCLLACYLQQSRMPSLYFFKTQTCHITIFHLIKRHWCLKKLNRPWIFVHDFSYTNMRESVSNWNVIL